MRGNKHLFPLAALAGFALLAGCDVDQTQEGELPDVDVEGGQLPRFDADAPDVDVETREEQVEVPDVDIDTETRTVPVPDVDVDLPEEGQEPPQ